MIHRHFSYTPSAALTTAYTSSTSGASFTLTNTAPLTDSLGHLVTVTGLGATDLSAITAVITGVDIDGNSASETINLPNGTATVTSTKYYYSLVSVVPASTTGADAVKIGYSGAAVTQSYLPDHYSEVFNLGFSVGVTGTINYTVQATISDTTRAGVSNSGVWVNHGTVASKTSNFDGSYLYPIMGIRVLVNSVTAGATLAFNLCQGLYA